MDRRLIWFDRQRFLQMIQCLIRLPDFQQGSPEGSVGLRLVGFDLQDFFEVCDGLGYPSELVNGFPEV